MVLLFLWICFEKLVHVVIPPRGLFFNKRSCTDWRYSEHGLDRPGGSGLTKKEYSEEKHFFSSNLHSLDKITVPHKSCHSPENFLKWKACLFICFWKSRLGRERTSKLWFRDDRSEEGWAKRKSGASSTSPTWMQCPKYFCHLLLF